MQVESTPLNYYYIKQFLLQFDWRCLFLNQVDGCAGVHPSSHWERVINVFVVCGRKHQ